MRSIHQMNLKNKNAKHPLIWSSTYEACSYSVPFLSVISSSSCVPRHPPECWMLSQEVYVRYAFMFRYTFDE